MTWLHRKLSVVLDEIGDDFEEAALIAKAGGLNAVELRMAFGKNVVELSKFQLQKIKKHLDSLGLKICVLATPLLKCFIPGEEGRRKVGDQFAFRIYDYKSHKALITRMIEVADVFEVNALRCFSFWATEPLNDAKLQQIAEFMMPIVEEVSKAEKSLLLENEPDCYIKTAEEAVRLLSLFKGSSMCFLWDPGNGKLCGENEARALSVAKRWIAHVHLKDFVWQKGEVKFVPPGQGIVDYRVILTGLREIDYRGFLSFEPRMGTWTKDTFVRMVDEFVKLAVLIGKEDN